MLIAVVTMAPLACTQQVAPAKVEPSELRMNCSGESLAGGHLHFGAHFALPANSHRVGRSSLDVGPKESKSLLFVCLVVRVRASKRKVGQMKGIPSGRFGRRFQRRSDYEPIFRLEIGSNMCHCGAHLPFRCESTQTTTTTLPNEWQTIFSCISTTNMCFLGPHFAGHSFARQPQIVCSGIKAVRADNKVDADTEEEEEASAATSSGSHLSSHRPEQQIRVATDASGHSVCCASSEELAFTFGKDFVRAWEVIRRRMRERVANLATGS